MVLGMGLLLPAHACLWDYDTLAMERQKFPSVLELITGKFLRHSPEYYAWRIEDRQKKLAALPPDAGNDIRLPLRDYLAVAYDKLGRHDEAIAFGEETLALDPQRYESVANLGTFYIHDGQLEKGLELIQEAIRINPDAHFGREKYQQYLVEYLLLRRKEGDASLPLKREHSFAPNFESYVRYREAGLKYQEIPFESSPPLRIMGVDKEALKGLLGMMRFGNFQSPILLEALGDVLSPPNTVDYRQKHLAQRAYLAAAWQRGETTELELPSAAIQDGADPENVVARLKEEMQQAEAWYAQIVEDEKRWIAQGLDVDAAFAEKYYVEPTVQQPWAGYLLDQVNWGLRDQDNSSWLLRGIALLLVLTLYLLYRRQRLREQAAANQIERIFRK